MNGKLVAIGLVACAVLAGAGAFYAQVFGYYERVRPPVGEEVSLILADGGGSAPLAVSAFEAIDASSSPIRYRACFRVADGESPLASPSRFEAVSGVVPRNAPFWFRCFDAGAIDEAIRSGNATVFLGHGPTGAGTRRLVAIDSEGRGWAWNDLDE